MRARSHYRRLIAFVFALSIFPNSSQSGDRVFICTDNDGVPEIFDNLPPWCASKGYKMLDRSSPLPKVVPPALTEEEIAANEKAMAIRKRHEELERAQQEHDKWLLDNYGSEEDIERARDRKLRQLDEMIAASRGHSNSLKDRLSRLGGQAAEFERAGQRAPGFLQQAIQDARFAIEDTEAKVEQIEGEKDSVTFQMNADLDRFRHLQAEHGLQEPAKKSKQSKYGYTCANIRECNKAWQLSMEFVKEHATVAISLTTNDVIATEPPYKEDDLGIVVARHPQDSGVSDIEIEFMCHESSAGQRYCRHASISQLESDFYSMLRDGPKEKQ